jgi:SPP1 gp7 family putative phage head morphogenesis protein
LKIDTHRINKRQIAGGILSGKSTDWIAEDVRNAAGQEVWEAKRLVRTELTAAAAEGETAALEDAGISRYRFYATLDERTCPVCGAQDMKVFSVKDGKTGINRPPLHPNCRCVITAALTDEALARLRRRGRDGEGKGTLFKGDMTYEEWKKEYGKPEKVEPLAEPKEKYEEAQPDLSEELNRYREQFKDIPMFDPGNLDAEIEGLKKQGVYPKIVEEYNNVIKKIDNPPARVVEKSESFPVQSNKALGALADKQPLTAEDWGTVEKYTASSFPYNRLIQRNAAYDYRTYNSENITQLENVIAKSEVAEPMAVFRGGDFRNIFHDVKEPGYVMRMEEFASASNSIKTADEFANGPLIRAPGIMKIEIPAGKGVCLPIGKKSLYQEQGEVLLQRGSELEYLGTSEIYNGIPVMRFRVVNK